jgi:hypothetical protein
MRGSGGRGHLTANPGALLWDLPSAPYAPIGAQLHGATARRSVQMICAHVLPRSAYSQGARDRQIWCASAMGFRIDRPRE